MQLISSPDKQQILIQAIDKYRLSNLEFWLVAEKRKEPMHKLLLLHIIFGALCMTEAFIGILFCLMGELPHGLNLTTIVWAIFLSVCMGLFAASSFVMAAAIERRAFYASAPEMVQALMACPQATDVASALQCALFLSKNEKIALPKLIIPLLKCLMNDAQLISVDSKRKNTDNEYLSTWVFRNADGTDITVTEKTSLFTVSDAVELSDIPHHLPDDTLSVQDITGDLFDDTFHIEAIRNNTIQFKNKE